MKNNFFITGLPRSRTSWLANFFTYYNSFCYHEATRFCANIQDLKELMRNHEAENIGDADPALLYLMDDLKKIFPHSRVVLVERELHETIDSFMDFYTSYEYKRIQEWIEGLFEIMEQITQRYDVKTVAHDDLNHMQTCREVWEYLLPEEPFDVKRWNLLDELYINKLIDKHSTHVMEKSLYHKYIKYY
ncbi:MAG: hypothetical protein ACLFM7_13700 [Bacteroidales bacterium]